MAEKEISSRNGKFPNTSTSTTKKALKKSDAVVSSFFVSCLKFAVIKI